MVAITFITSLLLLGSAVLLNLKHLIAPLANLRGQAKMVAFLWFLTLFSMTVWVRHSAVENTESFLGGSYMLQLVSVGITSAIVLLLISQTSKVTRTWKNGTALLLAYGLLGMASAILSPMPLFTLWKSWLIVLDAFLVIVAIAFLVNLNTPRVLLNGTYAILQFFLSLVILGGLLWPGESLHEVRGLLSVHLFGVLPYLNPNEIGFIAAVNGIVALRRIPDADTIKIKYFYLASLLVSIVGLFFGQARTATLSFTLMAIVMSIAIRRLRWVAVLGIIGTVFLLAYFSVNGVSLGFEDIALQYLQRGVSDKNIATLTGRTELWQGALAMFLDSPLLGHGFETGVRFLGSSYGLLAEHMHNAHMQVIANSGAMGYLLWISMVIVVTRILLKMRKQLNLTVATEAGRFHFEILLVMGIIWIRTITGSVLVFHQYSLLIFMAIMVYIALTLSASQSTSLKGEKGATIGTLHSPPVTDHVK